MFGKLTQKMKFTNAKAKQQRIVLLLDEFPQLGKLESVEHQLNICAGYGIKVVIIAQSIKQIDKIYTKDNGIIAGCPVSIFYAPADLETAKVISEQLGDKTIETQSVSTSGELFKSNVSTSPTGRKLMTPEEVLRLSNDKEIVFINGFRPVLGDKIKFFEEPYFDTRVYNPRKNEEEPKPDKLQEGIHKVFDFLGIPYSSSNDVNEAQKGVGKPIELCISDVCTPVKKFEDIELLYKAEREADKMEAASIEEEKRSRQEKLEEKVTSDDNPTDNNLTNNNPKVIVDSSITQPTEDDEKEIKKIETTEALNEPEKVHNELRTDESENESVKNEKEIDTEKTERPILETIEPINNAPHKAGIMSNFEKKQIQNLGKEIILSDYEVSQNVDYIASPFDASEDTPGNVSNDGTGQISQDPKEEINKEEQGIKNSIKEQINKPLKTEGKLPVGKLLGSMGVTKNAHKRFSQQNDEVNNEDGNK